MATEKQLVEKLIEIHKQLEADGLMVTAGKRTAAELLVSRDVVPVVRCEDCRFSVDEDGEGWLWCNAWENGTSRDGYFHDGERRKDGKE